MKKQEKIMEKLLTGFGIAMKYDKDLYNAASKDFDYYYNQREMYIAKTNVIVEILIDCFNYDYKTIEEKIQEHFSYRATENEIYTILHKIKIFVDVHSENI